ncbi:MAG: ABC transporter ATP-binding protein [Planctomycetota bacterium]|nr:ABC transporter ATP-binding protein [Planctomycetota bacterium]
MSANPANAAVVELQAPSTQEAVVKCAGLTKIYRDFWFRPRVRAVDKIDLEIRRGEVFGLLGPNGSGKSTTIKMILGLLYPTSGRIAVFGKRPEDVATKQRIGYLPEESYLYRFLTARETLDYYGRLFHQDRLQRKRRIDMLLTMVGLDGVANRAVGEFSKGMQRRIGLAQALINDPDLLILDEPTTGMDPIGTRQIKDLIIELARPRNGKPGKTILLCSHLLSDVEDVCHRVSIMFGGKVRALGTCDELLVRQDMTTIQTEALDVQTIEEIENLLEARGKHIERV